MHHERTFKLIFAVITITSCTDNVKENKLEDQLEIQLSLDGIYTESKSNKFLKDESHSNMLDYYIRKNRCEETEYKTSYEIQYCDELEKPDEFINNESILKIHNNKMYYLNVIETDNGYGSSYGYVFANIDFTVLNNEIIKLNEVKFQNYSSKNHKCIPVEDSILKDMQATAEYKIFDSKSMSLQFFDYKRLKVIYGQLERTTKKINTLNKVKPNCLTTEDQEAIKDLISN